MSVLSRGGLLAGARESVAGTYLAPTFAIPWTKCDYETTQMPLRDESVRGDDGVLHGLYPGPSEGSIDMEFHAYADIIGNFLRMIGPDTVVAATSTTLSALTVAGATSITTAVTIPAGTAIKIDTAGLTEYAITGTPSGSGPFTIPLVTMPGGSVPLALQFGHANSAAVITTTTHTFAQTGPATRPPSWSFSIYDLVDYRGFPGCQMSELALKIDPKATITCNPKFTGFPEQVVSSFTNTYNTGTTGPGQPELGWGWSLTNAGGASTRGLSLDLTLKRAVEAIHASNGVQAPREVFAGALELDGTLKVIYENVTDMNLFLNWQQLPVVAALQKTGYFGGESLTLTMSQAGTPKFKRDNGQTYMQASIDLSAIYNATDSGICKAVLKNFVTAAY